MRQVLYKSLQRNRERKRELQGIVLGNVCSCRMMHPGYMEMSLFPAALMLSWVSNSRNLLSISGTTNLFQACLNGIERYYYHVESFEFAICQRLLGCLILYTWLYNRFSFLLGASSSQAGGPFTLDDCPLRCWLIFLSTVKNFDK
ncbi:hypothetical protein DUNSADRAFT_9216 [Dunaliella salina]|uniref:Uncharacterized protein n=1 Tax=Dunaliella salina TaxID=3046 RepID=A0ABQ7GHY4_DUNSA|nr:hypothetical protein DUNSADRAFT_9216 [Dunaliella salina]|eukprot:KAF5834226.1 hypothetical protein DUNSADRAFT_9216 [Dunaliella salina]